MRSDWIEFSLATFQSFYFSKFGVFMLGILPRAVIAAAKSLVCRNAHAAPPFGIHESGWRGMLVTLKTSRYAPSLHEPIKKWASMSNFFCRWKFAFSMALCGAVLLPGQATASLITVTKTVDAHSGPWMFVNGGLNSSYQYGWNNQSAPAILSEADGLQFIAGNTLVITYISGLTNAFGARPSVDAVGHTNYLINAAPGGTGTYMPSHYISQSGFPAYLNELVGVFANASGAIVGTPFNIGLGQSVIIPTGASRLQLGFNDDTFSDNTGSLTVSVKEEMAVPEPSTLALLCIGAVALCRRPRRA